MIHLAVTYDFPNYLLHPYWGWGYQAWSGILSDLGELTLIGVLIGGWWKLKKRLECHVESPENCHRFGYPVPGTGHRACRKHHPHAKEKGTGITEADIHQHHEESKC